MKILTKLEKNKTFWFLLGISVVFFLFRIPSLIEPYWYGDEGVYQVIARALTNGQKLYSQIWDNKPPLLYLIYALFNGDQFSLRLLSLITGITTVILFFKLAITIFKKQKPAAIATILFTFLFGTPILEGNIANAENFMLLPTIISAILVYKYSENPKYTIPATKYSILILAGFLTGIAFTLKIVALFDFAAFMTFLILVSLPKNFTFENVFKINSGLREGSANKTYHNYYKYVVHFIFNFSLGFAFPISLAGIYFMVNNSYYEFIDAVFLRNIDYVNYANEFFVPQGFLILKIILFLAIIVAIYKKRARFLSAELFILIWLIFSIFNSYFSGRNYPHYTLLILPSWSLFFGMLFVRGKNKILIIILLITSTILINRTFQPSYSKSLTYYKNAFDFVIGNKSINDYRTFFDKRTERDYQVASFIKTHTLPDDKIFIWGDNPQIYKLSDTLPAGRYTVSYHITQYEPALSETKLVLENEKPKYIIILNEAQPFPFNLPSYTQRFIFNESTIYERSF